MRQFHKPDYELKARVLETELPKLQREISRTFYAYDVKRSASREEFEKALLVEAIQYEENPIEWNEAKRINKATFNRNTRLKKRIEKMLTSGTCLFLTLTFDDHTMSETTAETRRKYVLRFFEQFGVRYIANVDYGERNGREHYHAIIEIEKIDYHLWEYGIINGQKVRYNADDKSDVSALRLAKYVSKLVNHAIKATTRRQALIYSRSDWEE